MKNFLLTTLACGLLTTVALPEAVLARSEGIIPAARAQGSGEPPIITINTEYGASLSFLETDEVIAKAWLGNPNAVEVGFDSQFGQAKVMFLKQEARSKKLDGTSLTVITQNPQGQTQLYSFLLEFKSGKPEQSIWVVRNQIIDVDPSQRAFKTQEQQLEREQQERAERERAKAQERAQRERAKEQQRAAREQAQREAQAQERAQRKRAKEQQRAAREQAQREREAQAQERKRLEQEKQALAKEREAQERERRRLERERQEIAQARERERQKLAQEKAEEAQRQARLEQEANEREQRAREQERKRLEREQQLAREKEAQRQAQLEQEARRERELAIAEEQRSQRQLATTETAQSRDFGSEILVATNGSPSSKPAVQPISTAPEEPQTVAVRQVEAEVTSIDKAHALRRGLIIARTKGEIDYNTHRQSAYSRMQTLIGLLFQGDEWDTAVQKAGIPAKFARDILEYGLN